MNENIDLTKILKDCPKGWNLYTPILGKVEFSSIKEDDDYPITVSLQRGGSMVYRFSKEGYFFTENDVECLLFPSKEQRDWSKFYAPWYKKEKFDPETLKPFERVLVRDSDVDLWETSLFSHMNRSMVYRSMIYPFICMHKCFVYCVPYNDDTKHLVGTTDEAPEYYRYWED